METDIRHCFRRYMLLQETKRPMLTRAASGIYRGGVTDMDTLCRLLNERPQELRNIRNISEKSIALARIVCEFYRCEGGAAA